MYYELKLFIIYLIIYLFEFVLFCVVYLENIKNF